jgi:hypothetical protein
MCLGKRMEYGEIISSQGNTKTEIWYAGQGPIADSR